MVSDQEIVNGVESLLRQSNPNAVTTINGVVQQLEAKLGLDLSHKAGFIRDLLGGGGGGGGGGSGGGGGGVRTHHVPQPSPPPPPPSLQPKDHFTLQHFPQFHSTSQQFPSHFALPPSHHHNHHHVHHPEEFNFRYPSSQQPQPQLYPYPHQHQHQHQHQHLHPQQRQHPHSNPNPNPNPTTHPQLHQQGVRIDGSFAPTLPEPSTTENKKESAPAGTKRRGGPGGLNKVCCVSPELQAVVGEPALPRTQIVKQLWAYIRKHNLQDPSNKRKIICNDALRLLFDTDCTDMFKMNKLLSRHITPLDPTKEPGPDSKRLKTEAESATESTEASSEASPEAASDGGSATVIISDALSRFFETEEREMPQSEAVRRVWEYIKVHQLEDHHNPMMIICDSKLQELFGCENISALEIAEMLMANFVKQL